MKVGLISFAKWHNRPSTGSSRIRVDYPIKYWPEAEKFQAGAKYDAVIYQKVYWLDHAKNYNGIKILDMCDPDWLHFDPVVAMAKEVDAITCSSEALTEQIRRFTQTPVYYVPDRFDMDVFPKQKVHEGRAKEVVWFGYRGNAYVLRSTLPALRRLGLNLSIISDDFTTVCDYGNEDFKQNERWTKWQIETVNDEIIKSDIVINPSSTSPKFRYKSNNKTITAHLLGMPEAHTAEDLQKFLDPEERKKEITEKLPIAKRDYDVRLSVEDYKRIIEECRGRR